MQADNPKKNASGCTDLTAYDAMQKVLKEEQERERVVSEFLHLTKALATGLGLKVINRIAVKDKTTGKEYW